MKKIVFVAAAAGLMTLAACNSHTADNAAMANTTDNFTVAGDNMDAMATDNTMMGNDMGNMAMPTDNMTDGNAM